MDHSKLYRLFHDLTASSIDEEAGGISIPHIIGINKNNETIIAVIAGDYHLVYDVLKKSLKDQEYSELIYGLDRTTKPGQGTEFRDCLAGAHISMPINKIFIAKPFVINYQITPRIVRNYDWNNTFWKTAVQKELMQLFPLYR